MWLSLRVPLLNILEGIGQMEQLGEEKPFNLKNWKWIFFHFVARLIIKA